MSNHVKFAFVQGLSSSSDCSSELIWTCCSRHCWCVSTASEIVSWSYPQFYYVLLSIFMLTSLQYLQLLWMLSYSIHRVYHVHTSIDVAWLNDWDPAKQRRTDILFFRRCGGQAARCCSLASCWSGMAAYPISCVYHHRIIYLHTMWLIIRSNIV